jgi:hypothetical protein
MIVRYVKPLRQPGRQRNCNEDRAPSPRVRLGLVRAPPARTRTVGAKIAVRATWSSSMNTATACFSFDARSPSEVAAVAACSTSAAFCFASTFTNRLPSALRNSDTRKFLFAANAPPLIDRRFRRRSMICKVRAGHPDQIHFSQIVIKAPRTNIDMPIRALTINSRSHTFLGVTSIRVLQTTDLADGNCTASAASQAQ